PVDVFVSADEASVNRAIQQDSIQGPPIAFARNGLALIIPPGNPANVQALQDLARPGLTVLLCGPEVPAGRYARTLLESLDLAVTSRSDEPSVQAVLYKVALGEADAGLVYRTDAQAAGAQVQTIDLPPGQNLTTRCLLATRAAEPDPEVAAFVSHLLSPTGQAALERHGFLLP
ncbi:MAG: molybdate ABC transporter substrate-binding protein, partial [Planctomycetota bacterium]